MAKQQLHFSELKAGRCGNFVVASLLRFWEPRNVKKGGELLDVDLVVLMEIEAGRHSSSAGQSWVFGKSDVNSDPGVNQRESRDLILMEFSASAVTTSSCTTDTFDSDVFALLIKTWNCTSNLYFSRVTETEGRMLFITPHNDFAGKDRSITSDDQRNNSSHVRTETETNVSPMAFLEALLLHILTLATGFIPQLLLIYLY
ncbi:hypothetical protein F2Q70_00000983 [Brassica cretica]|uniref:Uncharacterized protein n=1 Tax=Brassica cretica TaxID=69181 RepID=A0A8S9IZE9_BRACR|nr:hypothetical protein F2Q70_00000983 [Brassica cretica]